MEQILIGPTGEFIVVDSGPRGIPGPPGPQGNPGPATPGSGRVGVEVVTPVIRTYGAGEDAHEYDVYEVGGTNSQRFYMLEPGASGRRILLRAIASVNSSSAEQFYVTIVAMDPSTDMFYDTSLDGTQIGEVPVWSGSAGDGSVSLVFISVPAGAFGEGSTELWLPAFENYVLARIGQAKVSLVATTGDGSTTPDSTANLCTEFANVSSANINAGAYIYPSISIINANGSRPLRLEITNAAAVTKFDIVELTTGFVTTFDPDALGLRVGSSILGTVHLIVKDSGSLGVVVDPIGGGA